MLITRRVPASEALYTHMSVTVGGLPVQTPVCRVSAMPYNTPWPGCQRPLDQTEEAAFVGFEADEPITLTVTYDRPVSEVLVRPLSKHVTVLLDGQTATFTLPAPGAYTLEADGFHNALHIFFDPIRDFADRTVGSTRNVITFGPGVHRIGCMELTSGTTVLIDRDAYLIGSLVAYCAEDIDVLGYGVIDGREEVRTSDSLLLPRRYDGLLPADRGGLIDMMGKENVLYGALRFFRCRNVHVEGPILRDTATFAVIPANCENCTFENIKTIGMWKYNSDGIDLFNCRNIIIRNCFLRNFDDCIVIKGICGWDTWNNENILVEGCVVWCDWGRNLELGAETNAPEYRNIIFRDCDCIHGSTIMLDIQHHNRADIHHVLFENIRCEYTRHQLPDVFQNDMNAPYPQDAPQHHPLLMCLPIYRSGLFSEDGLNGRTHDILFKDIQVLTDDPSVPMPESSFTGLDADHTVERVNVENVTFNGTPVSGRAGLRLNLNAYTSDIRV